MQAPTFLEHLRLQLHLARARVAHPQPWHIDARDPVAGSLVSQPAPSVRPSIN
jgi:hypothetical protein